MSSSMRSSPSGWGPSARCCAWVVVLAPAQGASSGRGFCKLVERASAGARVDGDAPRAPAPASARVCPGAGAARATS
eukprot:2508362-Lingulodinium_polyedra.AAC.1